MQRRCFCPPETLHAALARGRCQGRRASGTKIRPQRAARQAAQSVVVRRVRDRPISGCRGSCRRRAGSFAARCRRRPRRAFTSYAAHVAPADPDRALGGVVQARNELDERRFGRARAADDAHRRTCRDVERDVGEGIFLRFGVVFEADMVKVDVGRRGWCPPARRHSQGRASRSGPHGCGGRWPASGTSAERRRRTS